MAKWNFRHLLRVILGADDTPHRIALGTSVGIFVGLTPTFLIQTPLVLLVALVTRPFFKFNVLAAVIAGQITNPLTNIPIYWGQYIVGTWFVGDGGVTFDRFTELFEDQSWSEWWGGVKLLALDIGWPLLAGSAIVAPLSAAAIYPLMRTLVERTQARRREVAQ
jgi:uncharacterized protein (DUF2062 family)